MTPRLDGPRRPSEVTGVARRLNRSTLRSLGPDVRVPSYDGRGLRPGVVHLGTGAFHRAHQAVYLDDLAERGISQDWGLVGSGLRTSASAPALQAQEGLWSVTEVGVQSRTVRVVGVQQDHIDAVADPAALVGRLADPRTQLVTLTITAPGYDDDTTAAFDLLVEALAARKAAGAGPFTVLSCDNLPDNGLAARMRVTQAAEQRDPALARWVSTHVSFPSSMVDRITPPADAAHSRWLQRRHGLVDAAPVVCETFRQWVVEDAFCGERPPLEEVGVSMVTDARPFVAMKTGLLNAGHLALGFLGGRHGHTTTAAAMRDPLVSEAVAAMMRDEVAPLLDPVPQVDLVAYQQDLLQRFGNEALADPLERLRARGSVRVTNYLAPSLRRAVRAGAPIGIMTSVLATWIHDLAVSPVSVEALSDPAAADLLPSARIARRDARPLLVALGLGDLTGSSRFVAGLQQALLDLDGVSASAS